MYINVKQYLNFSLSYTINHLTLASVTRLFTVNSDIISLFTSLNAHSGP